MLHYAFLSVEKVEENLHKREVWTKISTKALLSMRTHSCYQNITRVFRIHVLLNIFHLDIMNSYGYESFFHSNFSIRKAEVKQISNKMSWYDSIVVHNKQISSIKVKTYAATKASSNLNDFHSVLFVVCIQIISECEYIYLKSFFLFDSQQKKNVTNGKEFLRKKYSFKIEGG